MEKEIQDTLIPVSDNQLVYRTEFENIYDIISFHKKRAMKAVHNESLLMLWEVGGYVSGRLKQSAWGDGVEISEYVPIETAEIDDNLFVPIELAQLAARSSAASWNSATS